MPLDVDSVVVSGRWFRHVPAGSDPYRRPRPSADGRWQRGDVVDALYLADSEACVWAEWYRSLAEFGIPPHVALPRDLLDCDVAEIVVADLSTTARLGRVSLGMPRPGRRTWGLCQDVGEQLHDAGWRGLLAPSAARPASLVLAVFCPAGEVPREVELMSSTRVTEPPPPPTGMRT